MMRAANRDKRGLGFVTWATDYLNAWSSHDSEQIVSFMAPDATYTDVALGQAHRGRADIAAWIEHMVPEFSSNYSFEPVYEHVTDSAYVLEWVMKGTHDGSSPQLPASGRQFAIHGASVGELEGGVIRRNTDYWNMLEFLVQIGAMPEPASAGGSA